MATIVIDRASSRCMTCDKGASPSETGHYTELGYNPTDSACQQPWDEVIIGYHDGTPFGIDEQYTRNILVNIFGGHYKNIKINTLNID